MEEKDEDKKFSLFRRKSTKKDHNKHLAGSNAVGERLSTANARSATLPSQPHAQASMTQSPSGGLFSKLKRRFRLRSSKGKYDFKDFDDRPQRQRRKSDDPMRVNDHGDLETARVAKVTSSVKTPRRTQNDKENVILIRKDKCVSVICQDADGASEVIFSNMPPDEDGDNLSESWGDGSEEDPYATINSVKEEIKEKFSGATDQDKQEKDRVRAKELLQHSVSLAASNNVSNGKPGGNVECVNVEDLYAKINSKNKGKKPEDDSVSVPQPVAELNRCVRATVRCRLEHEYESLEEVKKRASELFEEKQILTPVEDDDGKGNTSDDEFEIEPDYETLEDVRQKVFLNSASMSTNTVTDPSGSECGTESFSLSDDNKETCKDSSTSPTALTPVTSSTISPINTMTASTRTSPSGGLAPLAISIDSTLPTEEATAATECIYDNPNVILRKQFFRCSLGSSLSPHNRRSLVLSEPPWTKKTPAEEELVEKLSSRLAPPLPLRTYLKEEVGKSLGSGGSRHSWSSTSTRFWDMSESWHGGTDVMQSSSAQQHFLENLSKNIGRSKSQDFSDESKVNAGSAYSEKSPDSDGVRVEQECHIEEETEMTTNGVAGDKQESTSNECDVESVKESNIIKEKLISHHHSLSTDEDEKPDITEKFVNDDNGLNSALEPALLVSKSEYDKAAMGTLNKQTICEEMDVVKNSCDAFVTNDHLDKTVHNEAPLTIASICDTFHVIHENEQEIEMNKIDNSTDPSPCSLITEPDSARHYKYHTVSSCDLSTSKPDLSTDTAKDCRDLSQQITSYDNHSAVTVSSSHDLCSTTSTSAAENHVIHAIETPSLLSVDSVATQNPQNGCVIDNAHMNLQENDGNVHLTSQEVTSVNLMQSQTSELSKKIQCSDKFTNLDNAHIKADEKESKVIEVEEITCENDSKEVCYREKNLYSETHEWTKKRKSGLNASPDQDMAEISKAFEHDEFLNGFTEQYNAEEEAEIEVEGKVPSGTEWVLYRGLSPGCQMSVEVDNGNIAPLCGSENDNDCSFVDENEANTIMSHLKYDSGASRLTSSHGKTINDCTQSSNSHHLQTSAISDSVVNWEEFIGPSTYNLTRSAGQHSELSPQHSENQKLFLRMTRLLENVINGFCQGRLAIEMYYVLAGVFKWARCFNLPTDEFKLVENKLKALLLGVRALILSRWKCSLNDNYEREREIMQSEMDSSYQQIRTVLKTLEGLPAFLDVRLNLLGNFLLQYEVKHPFSALHEPPALRISQQELSFAQWALNSGIWSPRYDMKKEEVKRSSDAVSVDNVCGAEGGAFATSSYNNNDDDDASCTQDFASSVFREISFPFSSSLLSSPSDLSPTGCGAVNFSMSSSGILHEFLNMCDEPEDSDEEDENETIDTYIQTVTVPISGSHENWSVYDAAALLSLCRVFHGELAYLCHVRTAESHCKIPGSPVCSGKRSHLSNSDWEEIDHLMKKLVPHISPRLDFQFLLRTYAEFKFFVLRCRHRNPRLNNCFQLETEDGLHCCRKEEMAFLKLLRDELRHFASVIRQSTASESLFVEDKDVGYSLTTILRITLVTLKKMKFQVRGHRSKRRSPTNENSQSSGPCGHEEGAMFSLGGSDSSEEEDGVCEDIGDVPHTDIQDVPERQEDITPTTNVEFHIENYKRFRAGHMWTDLDSWHSPEALRDDPNVLDLRMGKSFFVDRDTNVIHSHNTSWGVYEEPKPLQEREDFLESMQQLQLKEWYWGPLSYEQAAAVLKGYEDGSFLVRDSSDRKYLLSLSFKSLGEVYHTRIEHAKGLFSFWSQPDSHGKARICEFIEKSVQNSHDGKFLYFLRPMDLGSPPLPIRLLNPVSRNFRIPSLRHLSRFVIRQTVRRDHIDFLPVPQKVKSYLRHKQFYVEFRGNERWTFEEENPSNEA